MPIDPANPLIVQNDRTLPLDVHSPLAEDALQKKDLPIIVKTGILQPTLIKEIRNNLSLLAVQIKPKVYEYGFLKE